MQEGQAGRLRLGHQRAQAAQRLITPARRLFGRHEEGEDADEGRVELPSDPDRPAEADQVRLEIVGDRDLADRRANRRDAHAARRQQVARPDDLLVGQVEHVLVPGGPELDVADAVGQQGVDLLAQLGGDLIPEAAQHKLGAHYPSCRSGEL